MRIEVQPCPKSMQPSYNSGSYLVLLLKIRFDDTNSLIHKFFEQFFPMEQKYFAQSFVYREDDMAVVNSEYILLK